MMYTERKITVEGVLREGLGLGLKNAPSLLGAVILWALTFWIPYLNVGTTIALSTIPIELSKGKIISPTFIFDAKYRKYMGEYFTLLGLMMMAIAPAFMFMIVPGYVIAIAWSLAVFIMLDKGIAPGEALIRSNKATYGYKWTIFFVYLAVGIAAWVVYFVVGLLVVLLTKLAVWLGVFLGFILIFAIVIALLAITLGCSAIIYRNLTSETPAEAPISEAPVN